MQKKDEERQREVASLNKNLQDQVEKLETEVSQKKRTLVGRIMEKLRTKYPKANPLLLQEFEQILLFLA